MLIDCSHISTTSQLFSQSPCSGSFPMALKIISFFNENANWRIAKTADGYCHRDPAGMPEWLAGLPAGIGPDSVEGTFQKFSEIENSLLPTNLSFKMTYLVGHSNVECFIFSSPEGDPFSVKIPPSTFAVLQEAFPSSTLPRMRIARLVVQQAISLGLPSVELLPETPLFTFVQSQIAQSLSP